MNFKKIIALFLAGVFMLSSCAYPLTREQTDDRLSEALLIDYTFLSSHKTQSDQTIGDIVHYLYRCEDGIEFEITSYVTQGEKGQSRRNTCNYIDLLFEKHNFFQSVDDFTLNGIRFERIIENFPVALADIKLSGYDDIEPAVDFLLAFADTLDYVPVNRSKYSGYFERTSHYTWVGFKLDYMTDEGTDTIQIARAHIPWREETLDREQLIREMEDSLAAFSKSGKWDFGVPMEVLERKRPGYIVRVTIDGEEIEMSNYFSFSWNGSLEDYTTSNIKLCYPSDQAIQEYSQYRMENFAILVEGLGGEFFAEGDRSRWTIGEDTWLAEIVITHEHERPDGVKIYTRDVSVSKNGAELDLNGGYDASREYSFGDLEQLLGVNIAWANHEAVAHINSNAE